MAKQYFVVCDGLRKLNEKEVLRVLRESPLLIFRNKDEAQSYCNNMLVPPQYIHSRKYSGLVDEKVPVKLKQLDDGSIKLTFKDPTHNHGNWLDMATPPFKSEYEFKDANGVTRIKKDEKTSTITIQAHHSQSNIHTIMVFERSEFVSDDNLTMQANAEYILQTVDSFSEVKKDKQFAPVSLTKPVIVRVEMDEEKFISDQKDRLTGSNIIYSECVPPSLLKDFNDNDLFSYVVSGPQKIGESSDPSIQFRLARNLGGSFLSLISYGSAESNEAYDEFSPSLRKLPLLRDYVRMPTETNNKLLAKIVKPAELHQLFLELRKEKEFAVADIAGAEGALVSVYTQRYERRWLIAAIFTFGLALLFRKLFDMGQKQNFKEVTLTKEEYGLYEEGKRCFKDGVARGRTLVPRDRKKIDKSRQEISKKIIKKDDKVTIRGSFFQQERVSLYMNYEKHKVKADYDYTTSMNDSLNNSKDESKHLVEHNSYTPKMS